MSETTVLDPPVAAIDDKPAEAILDTEDKGTADSDVTVQTGDTESTTETQAEDSENELKHSDARLTAEREDAEAAGYKRAREEDAKERKDRSSRHMELVRGRNGDAPAVIRATRGAVHQIPHYDEDGRQLTPAEVDSKFEGVYKTQGDANTVHLEAMDSLVVEKWIAEINRGLGDEANQKSFWAKAEALDPTLHVGDVLKLYVAEKALSSDALHDADPEELVKALPKLKKYVAGVNDEGYNRGRAQGRKDPTGSRSSGGESVPQSVTHDAQWAATAPIAEVQAWLKAQQ